MSSPMTRPGHRTWPECSVIQQVLTRDVWHRAERNETLSSAGLPQIDRWD